MNKMFHEAIETAQGRFREEIERALKGKEADPARINRRKNEQYHERLTRSCLGVDMKSELNDSLYALAVAIPEGLISKMYFLAWGDARKQKQTDATPNQLMKSYSEAFSFSYKVRTKNLVDIIKDGKIDKSLVCHGLSPESDTILVLAELGRSVRLTKALGLKTIEILLADISWVKYNRSISQKFDNNKTFLDKLRVCIDKRKRLYRALNLNYTTFGITDYGENDSYIKKTSILQATTKYRELAKVLWGERALYGQDSKIRTIIGKQFNVLGKKDLQDIPEYLQVLLNFDEFGNALETSLRDELAVLRTLSNLFSTFEEEIFIYYFAQYFAQRKYNNYLKIAPYSEIKFDEPFKENHAHFNKFIKTEHHNDDSIESSNIYFPQYRLGKYEILPYTSISGDVIRKNIDIDQFYSETILLEDSSPAETEKILQVLKDTPVEHRNRLMSDILSFLHFLFSTSSIEKYRYDKIKNCIKRLNENIFDQIFSSETINSYNQIFPDALKAIADKSVVLPFHIIPYSWTDDIWTQERYIMCTELIQEILTVVNEICE
ncbi:hypothetical protein [Candidatus Electronema sp. JM]|uniref:hypothetical protein n=1 Tax=Candidatus Electronema sp. JM TaxID=3401571 RepID=UPI003AA7F6B6